MIIDPIENARVLLIEQFYGGVDAVILVASMQSEAFPEKRQYWGEVALAVRYWAEILERAQA